MRLAAHSQSSLQAVSYTHLDGYKRQLFDTIEENFHITLTQYVLVDFYMFVDVIDALGGITINMTAEEISAANDCIAGLNKQLGVEYLWDGFIFADPGPCLLYTSRCV